MIGIKTIRNKQHVGGKNHYANHTIGFKIEPKSNVKSNGLINPIPINKHQSINLEPVGLKKSFKESKKFNSLEKKH